MTLASPHDYVPVLRWKRGERIALRQLGIERTRVIPLIEPVTASSFDPEWIAEFIDQISDCWGESPFFLDSIGQADNATALLPTLMKVAMSQSVAPILVTRLVSKSESPIALKSIGLSISGAPCWNLESN